MSKDLRESFVELTRALKELHRDLLMLEAKKLEGKMNRKISPYELLQASLHDPDLAWLRWMSAVIVHIDTILDETTNLSGQEANQVASEVFSLLSPPASVPTAINPPSAPPNAANFWTKYSTYLSDNPDIIMKHSKVKIILAKLRPTL